MKKNLAKPYILYVAEVIYIAISEIKSKEQNISNIDAMERFIGSPLYEKISSGKYHDDWFEELIYFTVSLSYIANYCYLGIMSGFS